MHLVNRDTSAHGQHDNQPDHRSQQLRLQYRAGFGMCQKSFALLAMRPPSHTR
ncbi:predicted protein [Streptomyces viridosporus ATCC 14672]|uniref:Predicted protein n=1 Tax=Streptomyces viridosporus (strain ATCC 14672 / DSM 40746 / JCM 4963 / KCTC 9882 / NRRL B-12104 / FH 1290) TaxID=566461 RepID=D6A5Q8_STRV1|nr:predicted protein [Streptomyces viridosporus ATCC 14672]